MMGKLIFYWSEIVINQRLTIILLSVISLFCAIFFILKDPVEFDNSFEMFMLKDDPNIEKFNKFRDLFGDAEYLSVGIESREQDKDVFSLSTIKAIHDITTMLEDHEVVTKVTSLSNYQYTNGRSGILSTDYLFPEIDSLTENNHKFKKARQIISNEKIAIDSLITSDLRHTRIIARTEYIPNENDHKVKISRDIYKFLEKNDYKGQGYNIRLGGGAIIAERFENLSARDSKILNPLVAMIFCLILWLLFGSFLCCLLPWVLIGSGLLIVKWLQAFLQFPMTVVNVALFPTMMIIGMGVSVHILTEFFRSRRGNLDCRDSAKTTIRNLFKPVWFTALTTAAGFGALSVTNLVPVKQYAILAASGSLIMFIVAMTTFISFLSFVKSVPTKKKYLFSEGWVVSLTKKVPTFAKSNQNRIVLCAFAMVGFCCFAVPKISVDSNIFNYFKSGSWIYQDMKYFDKLYKFSGIELVLDSGRSEAIKEPSFLRQVEGLQFYLNSLDSTGRVLSLVDRLKQTRKALYNDDEQFYRLPDSSEMTAQLLMIYLNSGPEHDLSDQIDFDNRFLRIGVPIENLSAAKFSDFYDDLRSNLNKLFPDLDIMFTGPLILYNAQEIYINSGLKRSFGLALLMIGLSFLILFKSVKYGIIALFPSVLPILTVGGLTAFIGISLDLGTIIVGAMAMGIAVDDAIHVMARYITYKEAGQSTRASVKRAVQESGKPVIFTSLILVFGFSAMLFASLIPTIFFGIFVALIMALAVIGDLIILPALLFLTDK